VRELSKLELSKKEIVHCEHFSHGQHHATN